MDNFTLTCLHCGDTFFADQASSFCPQCSAEQLPREKARLQTQLARAAEKRLPATLTLAQWLQTLADFNGLCAYCQQRPFEHLEHFIPIDAGGGTTVDNCIPACGKCNYSKGASDPDRPQLELFVNDPRERVRRYLADRAQDTHADSIDDTAFWADDISP